MKQKSVLYLFLVSLLLVGCGEANNTDSETGSSPSESAQVNSEQPDPEESDSDALDVQQPDAEQPDAEKPDPGQPESEDPNSGEPVSKAPEPDKAGIDEPAPKDPEPVSSVAANPNSTNSSSTNSDSRSQAAAANSGAGKKGRPINITFDDVKLDIKEDVVFKDSMLSDRVRELEGKYVRIRGFICAEATFKQKDIKQFILIRNNQCKFGPGGQFHHNMAVHLKPEDAIDFTTRAVTVEGKLKLEPKNGPNGKTWTVYHLEG